MKYLIMYMGLMLVKKNAGMSGFFSGFQDLKTGETCEGEIIRQK